MRALLVAATLAVPAFAAAAPAPAEQAMLVFVRLPDGKLVPVGAWKTDRLSVVQDVVRAREPGVKEGWLWRAGASLDERQTLADSGISSGDVLDLARSKPAAAAPADAFSVELQTLTGLRAAVMVRPETTVLEIKMAFAEAHGLAVERQRLLYNGKMAADSATVAELGLAPGAKLFVVVKQPGQAN